MDLSERYYKAALSWYELAVYFLEFDRREMLNCKIHAYLCLNIAKQEIARNLYDEE